jgi:hypothetical protein
MRTRPCKYCSEEIAWGSTEKGRPIPLDKKPVRVMVNANEPGRVDDDEPKLKSVMGWVPHHSTCTGVDQARADKAARDRELSADRRARLT